MTMQPLSETTPLPPQQLPNPTSQFNLLQQMNPALAAMNPQNMSMEEAQKFLVQQAKGTTPTPSNPSPTKHSDSSPFIKKKKDQVYWGPGGIGGMSNDDDDLLSKAKSTKGGMDISDVISYYGSGARDELELKRRTAFENSFHTKMESAVEMSAMNIIDSALVDEGRVVGPGLSKSEIRGMEKRWNDRKAYRKYKLVSAKLKRGEAEKQQRLKELEEKKEGGVGGDEAEVNFEYGVGRGGGRRKRCNQEERALRREKREIAGKFTSRGTVGNGELNNMRRKHRTLEMNPLGVLALQESLKNDVSKQTPLTDVKPRTPPPPPPAKEENDGNENGSSSEEDEMEWEDAATTKTKKDDFMIFDSASYFDKILNSNNGSRPPTATAASQSRPTTSTSTFKSIYATGDNATKKKKKKKGEPSRLLKNYRQVFGALKTSVDAVQKINDSKRRNISSKNGAFANQFSKSKYDGSSTNTDINDPDNLPNKKEKVEWRSDTRREDIKQVDKEAPIRAKTLVDILDTISDLRDDIEGLKKERRKHGIKMRAHGEEEGKQKGDVIESELKEMEEMLKELQEGRRKLMQQNNFVSIEEDDDGGGEETKNNDVDGDKTPDNPDSDSDLGGLDGLREKRRRRASSTSATTTTTTTTTTAVINDSKFGRNNRQQKRQQKQQQSRQQMTEGEATNEVWKQTLTTALASGASAEIQTNSDGCPLYYKLLLDLKSGEQENQYRGIYDFLKQASVKEQIDFLIFSLEPSMRRDLLPSVYAFLKVHAHSFKSLKRFSKSEAFTDPTLHQLLCCALRDLHIDYLSPILALIWLFSKIKSNRALFLKEGVVGVGFERLKFRGNLMKKQLKKGIGKRQKIEQQQHVCLTMLANICFN